MKRNTASQIVGAQMNSKTDGSAVTTGTTTVSVTGDGGTQATGSVGAGACTHEGGGFWTYAPAQAETNYDHVAFTFVNTAAVTATVQVYPGFPQTGDSFARIGAAGAGLTDVGITQGAADKVWLSAARTLTSFGTLVADAAAAVWASVARTLTAGTTDADVAAIKAKTDNLPADPADQSLIVAATDAIMTRIGAAGAGLTALGDARLDNLDAAVSSRSTFAGGAVASVTGAVGSVTATVNADVKKVNGVTVDGAGTEIAPWGPV